MATQRKITSTATLNQQVLDEACSFNEVVKVISPRWKMQILFSIYEGVNRFSLLKQEYGSLSKQVLSKRLTELEAEGFIHKEMDPSQVPTAIYYSIEPKAQALLAFVPQLCDWGDQWLTNR